MPLWISTGRKEYHMKPTKLTLTLTAPMVKQPSLPWKKQVHLKKNRILTGRRSRRSPLPSLSNSRGKRRVLRVNQRTHHTTQACSSSRDRSRSRTISSLTLSVIIMSNDTSRRLTQVTPSQHHTLTISTTSTTTTCSIKDTVVSRVIF